MSNAKTSLMAVAAVLSLTGISMGELPRRRAAKQPHESTIFDLERIRKTEEKRQRKAAKRSADFQKAFRTEG